jgi:molecular chaperone HscB
LQNHFELFGLAPAYALDTEALERSYRKIQSEVHPDRFAHAGDAERRASLQWTTRVNEAYRTLKDPVQRGKHLLELRGVDLGFETNTQMPTDFLLQQLEVREELERAAAKKDAGLLERIRGRLQGDKELVQGQICVQIDEKNDMGAAAELVRKLMFLDKLDEEIDLAYEGLE